MPCSSALTGCPICMVSAESDIPADSAAYAEDAPGSSTPPGLPARAIQQRQHSPIFLFLIGIPPRVLCCESAALLYHCAGHRAICNDLKSCSIIKRSEKKNQSSKIYGKGAADILLSDYNKGNPPLPQTERIQ